ncbi:MAG: twin-arginine translocase subunit TatC [Candidatus Villigracilaceae bacterium]
MRRFLSTSWQVVSAPFRLLFWLVMLPIRAAKRAHRFLTEPVEDRPLLESFTNIIQDKNTQADFWSHIEVLRHHILRSLLYLIVTTVVSFTFTERLIRYLAQLVGGLETLRAIEVTESIGVFMRVALLAGFIFAVPFIVFEFWLFIAPGLTPRTRQISLVFIPLAALFFAAGVLVAYYVLLPPALQFLLDFMGIRAELRPQSYFSFVTSLLFWIGIVFEFPLVVFALTWLNILQPYMLVAQWRFAIVIIAILAAIITPTVDPVNMGLLMLPMSALYFISIGMGYFARSLRRKDKNEKVG